VKGTATSARKSTRRVRHYHEARCDGRPVAAPAVPVKSTTTTAPALGEKDGVDSQALDPSSLRSGRSLQKPFRRKLSNSSSRRHSRS